MSESYILVLNDDKVVRHNLTGKAGYSLDQALDMVRVWDQTHTRIIPLRNLIELCIQNSQED